MKPDRQIAGYGGKRYEYARLKSTLIAVLLLGLAAFPAYHSLTSDGRARITEEFAFVHDLLPEPAGMALLVSISVACVLVLGLIGVFMLKAALDGRPALVINARGLWHRTGFGDHYAFEWSEISSIRAQEYYHNYRHRSLRLNHESEQDDDDDDNPWWSRDLRMDLFVNVNAVRGAPLEDIVAEIERYAPEVPIHWRR